MARRVRREPPRFRRAAVHAVAPLTPRMARVTLGGPEMEGLAVDQPAASVRLLLPSPDDHQLVMPTWNGNEFLLPDGRRPAIRTFTPRRADPVAGELDVDVVLHDGGTATAWAAAAAPGDEVAVSGPGRGYDVDAEAPAYLLAGDETALPAMAQLLGAIPATTPVQVLAEVASSDARLPLPDHPGAIVRWLDLPPGATAGDTLVAAVADAELPEGALVWAAGEAAAVQRIRRHLFDERGLPRSRTTVRGYWKHGRAGD